jgi:choline-sulfatase
MVASMMQPHDICEWLRLNLDNVDPPRYPELAAELPPLPANFLPNNPEPADIIRMRQTDEQGLGKWNEAHWRYYMYSYFRHVEQVDAEIGLLLRTLDETGYADNTAIVFVADHGEGLARHQLVRKNSPYDDASRVPMAICWPGHFPQQAQVNTPVSGLDIVPTLCELAGIPAPPLMRGQSLLRAIDGTATADRAVICDIPGNIGKVVRTAKYNYITYANDPVDMLFDMQSDPLEMHNLVADAAHADTLAQLRGSLREWERSLQPSRADTPNLNVWKA